MSTTVAAVQTRMLQDLGCGFLIQNGSVGGFAATTVTSVNFLENSDWASNHFRNLQAAIWRGTAQTSADYYRRAGDLVNSTGVLSHTGANYSDTTVDTEAVEIWFYDIRPDVEVLEAINRAMGRCFFPNFVALSPFDDGDMQSTATSSYTGSAGTTLTKSTTARRITLGMRALRVVNNSADDNAQSSTIAVRQGDYIYTWAISSVDVGGNAELVLYDVTNSADFTGTLPGHAEESPQFMWRYDAVPATCKEYAVRLNGEGASDDIYWSALGGYKVRDRRIDLPSTFDRAFEVQGLAYGRFGNVHNSEAQIADAASLEIVEIPQDQYALHFSPPEAHPRLVQFFNDDWFRYPLFIQGRRPYSDIDGVLTTPTGTINADFELIVAASEVEFLSVAANAAKIPDADRLMGLAAAKFVDLSAHTTTQGPAKRREYVAMRGMRN